jgi:tetratricopeptide (TPR) repeat protein
MASSISDLLTLFDQNEYSEFLSQYSQIVTPESETDNLLTAKGISYLRVGEGAEASKTFSQLVQKNPNNKEAKMYYTCKSPSLPLCLSLTHSRLTAAGNVWMQSCLEIGNELLSEGKMQEAYESYSQIKLSDYENLNKNLVFQLSNNLAVCLLNLERASEALDAFNSLHLTSSLEDDSNSPTSISLKRRADTALNKAIILKSLQRNEEAIVEFDLCLSIQTQNLTAICGKAELLSLLGKYEEAIEMTTAAITVNPLTESLTDLTQITQILSLWVARGFAFIKMSRFVEAMSDFNHVTALVDQPHYQAIVPRAETAVTEAYRLRNICLSYYGDHLLNSTEILKAIAIYDEAITVAGGEEEVSVNVLFNRAYGFYQLAPTSADYLDKAIEGFQAVVKRDPNHLQGQTGLGQALLNKADAMAAGTGLLPCPLLRLPGLSPSPPPLTLSFR